MTKVLLTAQGLEKIKKELDELKKIKRPEIIARIKTAKEFGDLSENAEYDDARNEQSFIEGRIEEFEEMIKNAEIIKENHTNPIINVGHTVIIECSGEKSTYELVGTTESDPSQGKISTESPIGKSIIGKKKGEKITINTPDGQTECKIVDIK